MSTQQLFRSNIWISLILLTSLTLAELNNEIENLRISGDFRSIKLQWDYFGKNVEGGGVGVDGGGPKFHIKYCELNTWQSKSRCKDRVVQNWNFIDGNDQHQQTQRRQNNNIGEDSDDIIDLKQTNHNHYEATINNLRVQTNYSINVNPIVDRNSSTENTGDDQIKGYSADKANNSMAIVSTKSFMARTLRCLANVSEIQVFTGPYFGGRIAVEGVDIPECIINGNRSDPKDNYNFTINHELCKSKTIDNVKIETMVMVNENREILTHNSRRYLVICGFDPDKYLLTASVAVPKFLLKKNPNHQSNQTSTNTKFELPLILDKRINPKGRHPVFIERNSLRLMNKNDRKDRIRTKEI